MSFRVVVVENERGLSVDLGRDAFELGFLDGG